MATERRLIDVDGLIDRIKQEPTDGMYTHEIIEAITEQPTVDAVEVVRCKDCKHCGCEWDEDKEDMACSRTDGMTFIKPNDFCSFGERRSDAKKTGRVLAAG